MIDEGIHSALIAILKSKRQKMPRSQRRRGVKPTRWFYPWSVERHYAAAIRAWLRPMKEYVHTYVEEHSEAILHGDSISVIRHDETTGKSFKNMVQSLNAWVAAYISDNPASGTQSPVYLGLGNIAESVFDFNEGQYEKSAKSALGIEFPVGEDWWPDAKELWQNKNYQLIQSDIKKYIGTINDLTEQAVTSGYSVKHLTQQILAIDSSITNKRANFIARDQIGKLNGQITHRRMESAGLSMYVWSTSADERVRPSHRLMDEKLCRWDDPTICSEDSGKTWIKRPAGAVHLHPDDDFQCRCTALAYWQEIVGEADGLNPAPPEAPSAPVLQPKKFVTQKMLQSQVADIEEQMKALEKQYAGDIDGKGSLADKQLYADLQDKKADIQTEIEKKKTAAQKSLLTKKVKKLEDEIQGIQIKTYSGIWKDDITTADYVDKASGIQAKKDYFLNQLNNSVLSDSDKVKFNLFLKDLDEFETEGKHYADIQAAIKAAKNQLTSIKKKGTLIADNPFSQERKDAALWAKTPKAADGALRGVCGEVWKSASKAEREAVYDYTQGSGGFNRPLRGYDKDWHTFKGAGKVSMDNEGRGAAIKKMTKLIDRSKYDFDVWLQRGVETAEGAAKFLGISEDNLRHWSQSQLGTLAGKDCIDHAFFSCGSSKGKGFSGYIFNVYCPKGTKMMYAEPFSHYGKGDKLHWDWDSVSKHLDGISKQSDFGYEDETVIQRGTTFRVIKVEKKGTDIFFDVEVVKQI